MNTTAIAPVKPLTTSERALVWLEVLLAVGAYFGAVGFITGGLDLGEATADLPFGSTVFAGSALALVNGVLPTVVVIGALRRRWWALPGHLVVGIALIGWILVQLAFLGLPPHWLQVLYFVWGVVIVLLALSLRPLDARRQPASAQRHVP
jgi:uncharacterized membrane protein